MYNPANNTLLNTTCYVYNGGSAIATYTKQASETTYHGEYSIYGMGRIATYNSDEQRYHYEINDYLGNVRAVISRNAAGNLEVLQATDYYPWGMEMPGRQQVASRAYRYGYQGQFAEKDEATGMNNFELRQWESRLCRWITPDPYMQYHSPYLGMGNNPVSMVDPDGGQSENYWKIRAAEDALARSWSNYQKDLGLLEQELRLNRITGGGGGGGLYDLNGDGACSMGNYGGFQYAGGRPIGFVDNGKVTIRNDVKLHIHTQNGEYDGRLGVEINGNTSYIDLSASGLASLMSSMGLKLDVSKLPGDFAAKLQGQIKGKNSQAGRANDSEKFILGNAFPVAKTFAIDINQGLGFGNNDISFLGYGSILQGDNCGQNFKFIDYSDNFSGWGIPGLSFAIEVTDWWYIGDINNFDIWSFEGKRTVYEGGVSGCGIDVGQGFVRGEKDKFGGYLIGVKHYLGTGLIPVSFDKNTGRTEILWPKKP